MANTLASGASGRNPLGVQVSPSAFEKFFRARTAQNRIPQGEKRIHGASQDPEHSDFGMRKVYSSCKEGEFGVSPCPLTFHS